MLQPPSPSSVVWISLICSWGGGSIAAAVTLDTVADESRNKMADGVTRSPARLVAESGRFVTMNALSTISCFCALLPTFLIFSFLIPVCFIFFVFLRLGSSSHLLLLYSQQVRIYSTCSCVMCILPHLRNPVFLISFRPMTMGTRCPKVIFPNYSKKKPCLLYTSPSPRDLSTSRMPSSA